MVSHMVFLTKLGFENRKNLVTPSPFCKVRSVTELLDSRVTLSPWKTKDFQGLGDDFGLKRPNHHLGPEYVHLFKAKKVWFMGRLFWEISSFMQKPWRSYTIWRYLEPKRARSLYYREKWVIASFQTSVRIFLCFHKPFSSLFTSYLINKT
jgi:hypothetical protein